MHPGITRTRAYFTATLLFCYEKPSPRRSIASPSNRAQGLQQPTLDDPFRISKNVNPFGEFTNDIFATPEYIFMRTFDTVQNSSLGRYY